MDKLKPQSKNDLRSRERPERSQNDFLAIMRELGNKLSNSSRKERKVGRPKKYSSVEEKKAAKLKNRRDWYSKPDNRKKQSDYNREYYRFVRRPSRDKKRNISRESIEKKK